MKKIISALLLLVTVFSLLASCKKNDDTQIRVAYMAGPTGMGMAKLISDNGGADANEQYAFKKYAKTSEVIADLKSKKIDMACLPTNEAAKFYNEGVYSDMQVIAINCLNSLCLLTKDSAGINSLNDLNGKVIYTCKQGTPRIILQKLLEAYDVNATIVYEYTRDDETVETLTTPQDLPKFIRTNTVADVILAPEPIVSNALNGIDKYKVTLDLGELWEEKFDSDIAMGCLVARKEFIEEHPIAVENFLEAYEDSIDYMSDGKNLDAAAELVVEAGIMDNLAPAKSALRNLSEALEYEDGDDMKETLVNIYKVFGNNVIGGKLPSDSFYYVEKDD